MTKIELGAFLKLFIRNGYVLDFSTNDFDVFTSESIGVPLCEKYQLSKGKSLISFCSEAEPYEINKLFYDLLQYYELNCYDNFGEEKNHATFERCKKILEIESATIKIETPAITSVDYDYIRGLSSRAISDINEGHYDSAITKSRTLLEEVFCNVIEARQQIPSKNGNIKTLYNQVKELYNMHQNKDVDKRINSLLSGLEKIIEAISQMRNSNSDAHGVGNARISIKDYHARFLVNSSIIVAEFILSVKNNYEENE